MSFTYLTTGHLIPFKKAEYIFSLYGFPFFRFLFITEGWSDPFPLLLYLSPDCFILLYLTSALIRHPINQTSEARLVFLLAALFIIWPSFCIFFYLALPPVSIMFHPSLPVLPYLSLASFSLVPLSYLSLWTFIDPFPLCPRYGNGKVRWLVTWLSLTALC